MYSVAPRAFSLPGTVGIMSHSVYGQSVKYNE